MTQEEYIEKTMPAVRFICKVYDADIACIANTMVAQSLQQTDTLIVGLEVIRDAIQREIDNLKAL